MKKLRHFFYSILYFSPKSYKVYYKLDVLLVYLKEIGIKNYTEDDGYYATITFNDGTTYKYWNENKWYAWMDYGIIEFSNDKVLTWNDKMPSSEVLYKYRKATKKYRQEIQKNKKLEGKNKEKISDDYSEYLPLSLKRKIKLKKLK